MARKSHTLPSGNYRVDHYASCGMHVPIDRELTLPQARTIVARMLRDRRSDGYAIARVADREAIVSFELTESEDSAIVPDDAGILQIAEDTVPAWECFECGDILPIGTACTCQEPIAEDDETTEDDE